MAKLKASSCEWTPPKKSKTTVRETNRIYKHRGDFSWTGVKTEQYKPSGEGWASIIRRGIIGNHGEKTQFHVRYFEILPGGYSSFEIHKHQHVVIVVRGKGKVRIGKSHKMVGFLDTLYIKRNTPHQLSNPFREPFGFFCIVNARRDKPVNVSR